MRSVDQNNAIPLEIQCERKHNSHMFNKKMAYYIIKEHIIQIVSEN